MRFLRELIEFIDYLKLFDIKNYFFKREKDQRYERGGTNFFRNGILTVSFQ